MADKNDADKKKKKSVIASLDLKNYKAKYTDSYGMGKPNEIDIDNFLIAEPDSKKEPEKVVVEQKTEPVKLTATEEVTKFKITPTPPPTVDSEVNEETLPKNSIAPAKNEIVNADSDFERRVNAEAENDFYDDKPKDKFARAFKSDVVSRKISTNDDVRDDEVEENIKPKETKDVKGRRKINLREPIKVNVRHEVRDRAEKMELNSVNKEPLRRTETYGIVISAVALIYSISTADRALLFFSVSLLLYLIRPIVAAPFGKYSNTIQNLLKGFSIALFFGAIFFAFF